MQNAKKVAEWLTAHPQIKMPEDVLATAGPWPSLEMSDFLVYARKRGDYPPEVIKLIEQLWRECLWAYDGWARAVVNDAQTMIIDMMHNAVGDDKYNFTRQFLQDYARSHGYFAEPPQDDTPPPWRIAAESGTTVPIQPPALPQEALDAGNVEPPKKT